MKKALPADPSSFCTELGLLDTSHSRVWHCHWMSRHCSCAKRPFFSLAKTRAALTAEPSWNMGRGGRTTKQTAQAMVLTLSSWKGQEEKGNFILLVDGIYNLHLFMESALKWYCYAVLARNCLGWPLHAQYSTGIIPYKRFALNVMKQMTKSINLEWCGYHKNDVNSEFTVLMKLLRIIIKTSTIFFLEWKFLLTITDECYRKSSTNVFKINLWHKDSINYTMINCKHRLA